MEGRGTIAVSLEKRTYESSSRLARSGNDLGLPSYAHRAPGGRAIGSVSPWAAAVDPQTPGDSGVRSPQAIPCPGSAHLAAADPETEPASHHRGRTLPR